MNWKCHDGISRNGDLYQFLVILTVKLSASE